MELKLKNAQKVRILFEKIDNLLGGERETTDAPVVESGNVVATLPTIPEEV